jgi:phosphatidylinositol-3-phosphatase
VIAITFDEAAQTGADADSSSCCIFPTYPNLPAATMPTGTGTTTTGTGTTTTGTGTTTTTTTSTTPTTPTMPGAGGGITSPTGGGGQVGMLLISKSVKPGTNDTLDYFNHLSLLESVENLFGLGHLGYASDPTLQSIPASDFSGKGP